MGTDGYQLATAGSAIIASAFGAMLHLAACGHEEPMVADHGSTRDAAATTEGSATADATPASDSSLAVPEPQSASAGASVVKPPSLRGNAAATGRLPPEVIQRVVRTKNGAFRACYDEGLKRNPKLEGNVTVHFVIGRDGLVASISGGGSIPDPAVISCVTKAFYPLSFPPPEGGVVAVTYPITFPLGD